MMSHTCSASTEALEYGEEVKAEASPLSVVRLQLRAERRCRGARCTDTVAAASDSIANTIERCSYQLDG